MSRYFDKLEEDKALIRAFASNPNSTSMVMKLDGGKIRNLEVAFPKLTFKRDSAYKYGLFECTITKPQE